MSGILGVPSYGVGTILGFALIGLLVFWVVQDITQNKHAVLRNYPLIGRLRYFFEMQGEYFRQYFFCRRARRDAVQSCHQGDGYTAWRRTKAACSILIRRPSWNPDSPPQLRLELG